VSGQGRRGTKAQHLNLTLTGHDLAGVNGMEQMETDFSGYLNSMPRGAGFSDFALAKKCVIYL